MTPVEYFLPVIQPGLVDSNVEYTSRFMKKIKVDYTGALKDIEDQLLRIQKYNPFLYNVIMSEVKAFEVIGLNEDWVRKFQNVVKCIATRIHGLLESQAETNYLEKIFDNDNGE